MNIPNIIFVPSSEQMSMKKDEIYTCPIKRRWSSHNIGTTCARPVCSTPPTLPKRSPDIQRKTIGDIKRRQTTGGSSRSPPKLPLRFWVTGQSGLWFSILLFYFCYNHEEEASIIYLRVLVLTTHKTEKNFWFCKARDAKSSYLFSLKMVAVSFMLPPPSDFTFFSGTQFWNFYSLLITLFEIGHNLDFINFCLDIQRKIAGAIRLLAYVGS